MQSFKIRLSASIALLACASLSSLSWSATLHVPSSYTQIKTAIAAANAGNGDIVQIDDPLVGGDPYKPFNLNKGLTVINAYAGTITIDAADTADYAVQVTASGGVVQGFKFTGGAKHTALMTAGTLRNCRVESPEPGVSDPYYGVILVTGTGVTIEGCSVAIDNGKADAVFINADNCTVRDCRILVENLANYTSVGGICFDGSNGMAERDTIEFAGGYREGWGIFMSGGGLNCTSRLNVIRGARYGIVLGGYPGYTTNHVAEQNIIENCAKGVRLWSNGPFTVRANTIVFDQKTSGDDGILIESSNTGATIERNLIVRADRAVRCNVGSTSTTYAKNAYDDCTSAANCSHPSTNLVQKAVLFCDERESSVQMYTQRIDSEAAKGNNGWYEAVGARDVECAWGTLARATTIGENSTVTVLEDLIAPSGKVLIVDSGSILKFDAVDNSAGGSDTGKNELIVNAGLTVNGTSSNKARFISAKATPAEGDWYGIRINDVAVDMSYFEVNHANYGIRVDGVASVGQEVNAGTFALNQTCDIYLTNTTTDEAGTLDITNNAITVGGGTGIFADDNDLDYALIQSNTLTGNSSSLYGVRVKSTSEDLDLLSNTLSGFSAGDAIYLENAEGVIRGNTISGSNKYGIRQTGGTPTIGAELSTQGGNSITGCSTTGFLASGSGTNAYVRKNTIASNYNNVVAQTSASPNLGTTSDDGNNDLAGSTNYCLWNKTSGITVSAYGNWFGECANPPGCSSGSVNIGGYLCADPTSRKLVGTEPVPTAPRVLLVGPNPMHSTTEFLIAAGSAVRGSISIGIFDVAGRLVREMRNEPAGGSEVSMIWDGRDQRGSSVESGIYFARVMLADTVLGTTKLVVAR